MKKFIKDNRISIIQVVSIILLLSLPYVWIIYDAHLVGFGVSAFTMIKIAISSMAFPLLGILLSGYFRDRLRPFVLIVAITTYFLLMLFFSAYLSYFNAFPGLSLLQRIYALRTIFKQILVQVFTIREWLIIVAWIISVILCIKRKRLLHSHKHRTILVVPLLCIFALFLGYRFYVNRSVGIRETIRKDLTRSYIFYGLSPTLGLQLYDMLHKVQLTECVKPRIDFKELNTALDSNIKNIIAVQVESFDDWVIAEKVNGEPVMPFLNSLKDKSRYYTNAYAMHSGGATTDSELSSFFSLLPLQESLGFMSARYNHAENLIQVLKNQGINNYLMHSFKGTFFNRKHYYPLLGIKEMFFDEDYSPGSKSEIKDELFFRESVDKILNFKRPFFAYMITMQSHGPFRVHDKCAIDVGKGRLMNDYICTMVEVDKAFKLLFEKLESSGLLEDTAVLIYGDHMSAIEKVKREKVPLLIYYKGIEPKVIERPVSQIDIAPTITYMLGLPRGKTWLGENLFVNEGRDYVPFNDGYIIRETDDGLIEEESELAQKQNVYSRCLLGAR